MIRGSVRAGIPLIVALSLGGCGTSTPSSAAPSVAPTASLLPADSQGPSPAGSGAIVVDETLLRHLPVEVGGIVLVSDPATAASIATDPDLAAHASAIAVAYAIAPGASAGDDLAVASVVRLRPDVFDDAFFRSWRDSYDTAACASAGGTSGNAEADIGGRHAYIGTCAGGAHTYHVYLEAENVIVSVTSVGEKRLGEQVVAGLRE